MIKSTALQSDPHGSQNICEGQPFIQLHNLVKQNMFVVDGLFTCLQLIIIK